MRADDGGPSSEVAAWLRTFEAELDFVYLALRRQGVRADDAEDLAQDVFLILWRRWRELDRSRPVRPWLSGVVAKIAQQYRKREGRFVPAGLVDREDTRRSTEDQLGAARARALVLRALSELSDKQRAVVVMHDLDGLPMRQVAGQLAVPLFTAYTRLRTGRQSLAAAIDRLQTDGAAGRFRLGSALALWRLPHAAPPVTAARPWRAPWVPAAALVALGLAFTPGSAGTPRPATTESLAGGADVRWGTGARVVHTSMVPPRGAGADASASEADAAATLGRGLIGYWRFDEPAGSTTVSDRSGGGNDCQVRARGAVVPGRWVEGVVGGAIALDGSRYLECPRVDRLARLETELTIALWIKTSPGESGSRQALVTRQLETSGDRLFSLRMQRGSLEFLSHVWKSLLRRPYDSDGWTHVAAVRDAKGIALYLDGVRVGRNSRTAPGGLGGGSGALIVGGQVKGREPGQAYDRFRGAIDELLVYDRALPADQIAALAARVQPGVAP
jgi:RNA polymerase sigma-70 factor (ECF subfamily)